MEAIKFKECNAAFAENQDEYNTLHVFFDKQNGMVVSCYKLSFKDIFKMIFTRKIWLSVLTFGNPLQPQLLTIDKSVVFESGNDK